MGRPHLPPSPLQLLLSAEVPVFVHHAEKQHVIPDSPVRALRVTLPWTRAAGSISDHLKAATWWSQDYLQKAVGTMPPDNGKIWAGKDNVTREGGSETVGTPCAWCKSGVEGTHLHTEMKSTKLQCLRKPLGIGTVILAVCMSRNACHSISDRLPQRSKRGCFFHLKNNFLIVMMVHNDTVLSVFRYWIPLF